MAIPSPATADIVVRHDLRGRMAVYYKGERLPCVVNTEATNGHRERAQLKVTFAGIGVRFETEEGVD